MEHAVEKRVVVIHQPDFMPYLGFFHRLFFCDVFVLLDHVQLLKRGWHHRDKIKGPQGELWLTVPVKRKNGVQRINEAKIDCGQDWTKMTGYPFVYAVWSGTLGKIKSEYLECFNNSLKKGILNISKIAEENSPKDDRTQYKKNLRYLKDNIKFNFGLRAQQGLIEFYRYAEYYKLIEELPDLRFFG